MKVLLTGIIFLLLLTAQSATAQDSLSIRDVSEIRYKAESLVRKELNELVNSISSTAFESQEIAESIQSSYSGNRNHIFRDSLVLVENDINPAYMTSAQAGDETLDKYLKDLDILYKKSDSATITFSNLRSSSIKKKDNIYIKVYFNSLFTGKSTVSDKLYNLTNRIAEITAQKDKNQWRLYIVRLGFYNPADTVADIANDMPVKSDAPKVSLAAAATAKDSAAALAAIAQQKTFDEEEAEKATKDMIDQEKQQEAQFRNMINQGDKALARNDFTNALKFYKSAQDLDPNNPEVRIKARRTTAMMEQFTIDAARLFQQYRDKARLEENSRQYKEAIEDYQNAIKQKPDEAANYDTHLRELTDKYRVLSDLQEKYNSGLYKEALKEYTAAIQKDPKNSDYYLGRGHCYEKLTESSKNIPNALKDYTASYDLDHNNLSAIQSRAELYYRQKDYFKALSDYKIYLTIYKENTTIYEKKSELHVLLHLPSDALSDLDEGLAVNPKAAHLYLSKGILLYAKGDIRAAAENFTTSIRIDSNDAQAWYRRGQCLIQEGKVPAAASDFASARSKGLDSVSIHTIKGYAEDFYQRSGTKFEKGVLDSAIAYINYAVLIDKDMASYRFALGEYYFSKPDYRQAIENYDKAISLDEQYLQAFIRRGEARYRIGDYLQASEDYQHALKLSPQHLLAQKGAADSYFALKEFAKAAAAYETCLKMAAAARPSPSPLVLADIYSGLSSAFYETGDYEKALNNAKNAVKNNKALAEAWFNRGRSYYKQNQLSDAIEDLNKAVSMMDNRYQWHYALAIAYQDKKDLSNAAIQYSACHQWDSMNKAPEAVYKQGFCLYSSGNYPGALPLYLQSQSLHLDTAIRSFDIELGAIYLNTGKYDSAYGIYNRVYQKDSTNGLAAYGIGISLALKGNSDGAIPWFERSFQTKALSYSDIKKDKLVADLRNNKKFKDLLKKYF